MSLSLRIADSRFREELVRQLVFFDENSHEMISSFPSTAKQRAVHELLDRYCGQIRLYMDGVSPEGPDSQVWIGSRVKVRNELDRDEEELCVVLPHEVDPYAGKISFLSPVGQHLLLMRPGSSAEVASPGGNYRLAILEISYGKRGGSD